MLLFVLLLVLFEALFLEFVFFVLFDVLLLIEFCALFDAVFFFFDIIDTFLSRLECVIESNIC